jgi:signal transduction histidine kinase
MRPKPFLTYFILCGIPLSLFAGLNYWNGIRTVDATVSTIVQNDLNASTAAIDEDLRERKYALLQLAIAPPAQGIVRKQADPPLPALHSLPDLSAQFQTLILFDDSRQPLWIRNGKAEWINSRDWRLPNVPQPDRSVWDSLGNVAVDKPGRAQTLESSVPIHDEKGTNNIGAVLGVVDLESVFANAVRALETKSNRQTMIVVLDSEGKLLYHSDRSLKLRPTNEALQGFEPIANAMARNENGVAEFHTPDGSYLAAYSAIPNLNVAIAVARRRSEFIANAQRWGMAGVVLALLAAMGAAFMLERHVGRRSKGIERVKADVSAIAKGELDRRIILQSSDEARVLADNINVMTERLRAQIAREEESRQFDSFVRLSAMLTHDLKNAIEGLSLTVGNMERHFDNPQFRADALKGLTSATDKLKALVARLARPITTLSGEHKRPTNIDLIPIIQRVLAVTAEPQRGKHSIVTRLPQSLYALADPARVEEVIENLVLNAFEAMVDKGGTLTIEAAAAPNGAAMFSVSDTGRGMTRQFIETRLFRPFSTTKKTGIGLGLYTCREVITASGGTIEVDSVEGAGTTFRVVLPSVPHDRRN